MPDVNKQAVKEQLEVILESRDFSASDRFRQFLRFVVEETLAGRENELKAYTIATQVFGRDKNFDPLLDPVVRVEASKLRNKLEQFYLRRKGRNKDKVLIGIPKGTYVPTFSIIEEPALKVYVRDELDDDFDDYVEEDSSDLHGDEPDVAEKGSSFREEPDEQGGVFAEQEKPSEPTVAILPFVNISSAQEIGHLLSGLAEELAIALTKFEDLKVISAHAMNLDTAAESDPRVLSKSLGARFILYGSAQLDSNIIRVRIKLADTASYTTLWAEKFDEPYTATGLFEIIDTTVAQVTAQIGDSFGYIKRTLFSEAPSQRTGDIKAYEAILYYHHWAAKLAESRFIKAKEALDKAIEADPRYSLAHAMLADIYAVHYQWGYDLFPNDLEMAQKLSKRAIELDSHCQYAQWSRAYSCYLTRDHEQFVQLARLAISLNPADTNILAAAGQKLAMSGNWEEGLGLMRQAERLNPFLPSWFRTAIFIYHLHNNDLETALAEARMINSPLIAGYMFRSALLGAMGRKEEAALELQELLLKRPSFSENYQEILRRIVFQDSIKDILVKGLQNAGI